MDLNKFVGITVRFNALKAFEVLIVLLLRSCDITWIKNNYWKKCLIACFFSSFERKLFLLFVSGYHNFYAETFNRKRVYICIVLDNKNNNAYLAASNRQPFKLHNRLKMCTSKKKKKLKTGIYRDWALVVTFEITRIGSCAIFCW